MTWMPHDPAGNVARIQLDAACTLTDGGTGTSETFYLIVPCRSERMYADGPLYQMPNYEFGMASRGRRPAGPSPGRLHQRRRGPRGVGRGGHLVSGVDGLP